MEESLKNHINKNTIDIIDEEADESKQEEEEAKQEKELENKEFNYEELLEKFEKSQIRNFELKLENKKLNELISMESDEKSNHKTEIKNNYNENLKEFEMDLDQGITDLMEKQKMYLETKNRKILNELEKTAQTLKKEVSSYRTDKMLSKNEKWWLEKAMEFREELDWHQKHMLIMQKRYDVKKTTCQKLKLDLEASCQREKILTCEIIKLKRNSSNKVEKNEKNVNVIKNVKLVYEEKKEENKYIKEYERIIKLRKKLDEEKRKFENEKLEYLKSQNENSSVKHVLIQCIRDIKLKIKNSNNDKLLRPTSAYPKLQNNNKYLSFNDRPIITALDNNLNENERNEILKKWMKEEEVLKYLYKEFVDCDFKELFN